MVGAQQIPEFSQAREMGAASSSVRCEALALSAFGFTLNAYSRGASTKLLRTRGDDSSSCRPTDE